MLNQVIALLLDNLMYLALYLSQGSSFPKPPSQKVEREWLIRIRQGDEEARRLLIEHNLRLVAHIIKKFYSSFKDQEDLISIGSIGLIKAVSTFDYEKGTRFATYAARCIENEILMYFRNLKKSSQDVFISDSIDIDKDGNSLTLSDVIADTHNIFDDIDLKLKTENLNRYIAESLSERERMIIEMRYGLLGKDHLTQREVAQKLGISRSYVSRIEKKALLTLKKRFDGHA